MSRAENELWDFSGIEDKRRQIYNRAKIKPATFATDKKRNQGEKTQNLNNGKSNEPNQISTLQISTV